MNKAELVLEVQKLIGKECSKASAERTVNAVIEAIKRGMKKDKVVQILGLGTFLSVKRAGRMGINPQTREKMKIKPSKTVKFKPGAQFKELA